jgi:hypothetical protein
VHPLQGGIFRLKHPSERRPGLSRENPWFFWPRFTWETLVKHVILARTIGIRLGPPHQLRNRQNEPSFTLVLVQSGSIPKAIEFVLNPPADVPPA